VRGDGSPSGLREALTAGRRELALYVLAGVVYVAVGAVFPELLFAWVVCAGWVVLLPAVARRLKRGLM